MLEAAWKAVIAAFNPRSMVQLTQVNIDKLVLQPMAAALRHGSQAMQDMTRDFWGYSDARSVLSAFDVSIVQSALPSLEDHNKMVSPQLCINNLCELEIWHQDSVQNLAQYR
jgi:hypothetical protein